MTTAHILTILMSVSVTGLLLLGYPVAFTLAGTALFFALIAMGGGSFLGWDIGLMNYGYIGLLPERILGIMTNEVLLAVPLFIAMGIALEKSNVAEDLLNAMGRLFGRLKGGLGLSVTIVGALMAASSGIVGATVVTMGLLSLPTMLKRGYDPGLAAGSIAASGTLGQIIPPSIVLVILADVMSGAWQQAQIDMGLFSPTPLTVGDLFAGALLPGLLLVALYLLYQTGVTFLFPEKSPPHQTSETEEIHLWKDLVTATLPPVLLILAVLGSILAGIATPTEAAAVGAVGALLLGALRREKDPLRRKIILAGLFGFTLLLIFAGFYGPASSAVGIILVSCILIVFIFGFATSLRCLFKIKILQEVMKGTARTTSMVFTILIGAALFSLVFRGLDGDALVANALTSIPGGLWTAVATVMLVMFLLGFVLDFIEITFVVVPIVAPVLLTMGVDPVWLGIMMAINLQTSFLTPPFGFALFYLRGVAPENFQTKALYKGVIPFVIIQILVLFALVAFPGLATWLPGQVFG